MTPNLFHRALSQVSDKTRERVREWCDKKDSMNKREIKFRAWHREANEMLFPEEQYHALYWLHEGQPVELMQYTGLCDRNGVEIYEGDVLCGGTLGSGEESVYVIEFSEGRFIGNPHPDNYIQYFAVPGEFSVLHKIGNVHENPELITKTAEG